jgi:ABC-2 type transport system ATP-binding protein
MKETLAEHAAAGAAVIVSSHLLQLVEDLCTVLLILHQGKRIFLGSIDEARQAFAAHGEDASLEEVFFRATEGRTARGA